MPRSSPYYQLNVVAPTNQGFDAQNRRFDAQDERLDRLQEGITNFDRRVSGNVGQIDIIRGQTETVNAP